MPSCPSGEARRSAMRLGRQRGAAPPGRAPATASSGAWRARRASGPAGAAGRRATRSTAASSAASSARTSCTRPIRARVAASKARRVRNSARACDAADLGAARTARSWPGSGPRRTSVKPKRASARARARCRSRQARPVPPPSATPVHARHDRLRAAVDGGEHRRQPLGVGHVLGLASARARRASSRRRRRRRTLAPRPASTTRAHARRPRRAASNASCSAAISAASNALRRSGRSSQSQAAAPRALDGQPAHMRKTPKRGSGTGARVGGGQAERERAARVEGVEHAVVPEPRGRVVRRPLVLVPLDDRRLEGLPLGLVELVAARVAAAPSAASRRPGAAPITEMRAFGHMKSRRGE